MPPRIGQEAGPSNPGPVDAPPSPGLTTVDATINSYPDPHESSGPTLPASFPSGEDAPGPSSTYMPRQTSPPLPDFRSRFIPQHADEDESDDEVLTSLPIYLSPALFPSLHLLQFPLNHRSLTAPTWARERGKHVSARVKEGVGRLEVEVPVDAGREVWRDERAQELGFMPDLSMNGDGVEGGFGFSEKDKDKGGKGKKGAGAGKRKEKWGEKVRYRSEGLPNATGYYSGMIHDGALHLHPVSKVMQMRTSLAYLDDLDARSRSRKDEEEREKRAKAPMLPHRKLREEEENDGSGSIKDFRNKMWTTALKEDEDRWLAYEWVAGEDSKVDDQYRKLIVPDDKRGRLECKTRGLDYLDKA